MKKVKLLSWSVLIFVLVLGQWSESYAVGSLFSRPRFSNEQYDKMWIQKIETSIDIQEQISVTHIDQTFFNELNTSVEAIYIFPLPENAMISELVYWVNGTRIVADIREREQARSDYNKKLRQWLDPALLEYLGDNLFRLSIVPINANTEVRTEITYVEMLQYDLGTVYYKLQLNTLELSSKPLKTVALNLNVRSHSEIKKFSSPSHQNSTATQIQRIAGNHYALFFGDENFYPDRDLEIEYELVREEVDFHVLTYTPAPQDSFGTDSFYALWITPPDSIEEQELIPKDIVFTADVSSSMEGQRIDQVKEALDHFLSLLHPQDRFNIVTFGTFVKMFKTDLVEANNDNIAEAREYVRELYALGMTNIDKALLASLQQSYGINTSNNLIFLTDGQPTWGETNSDSILARVEKNNQKDVRIFSFGIGDLISRAFLNTLSADNHGYANFITSDDSIALVVKDHFTRISKPVLQDISINLGGLQASDRYPKNLDDLFWGSQVIQLGLYKNSGVFGVTLSGQMRSERVEYYKTVHFSDTLGGHRFVPRLWASAKINHILELIALYGETEELVNQVIELSLRFQILTPYTAFYADPEDDDATGVAKDLKVLPNKFSLVQNYPNPFNPETTISYNLPGTSRSYHVVLKIYNALGQLVTILVDKIQLAGQHKIKWKARDKNGKPLASGIYYYVISAGNFHQSRKMILIR